MDKVTEKLEKLEKKALDLEKFVQRAKRKLLEFEILLSERDIKKGKFKIYKNTKEFLKNL